MSEVTKVTTDTFDSEVLQCNIPVIVDFFAIWCGPCRQLSPMLDRLASEFAVKIKFVKVDSDQEPHLAETYSISSLPTLIFFERGQNVGQVSGLPEESALRAELENWIATQSISAQ